MPETVEDLQFEDQETSNLNESLATAFVPCWMSYTSFVISILWKKVLNCQALWWWEINLYQSYPALNLTVHGQHSLSPVNPTRTWLPPSVAPANSLHVRSNNTTLPSASSLLNFGVDVRKGKKATSQVE
jgi:hypothetical protein